MLRMFSGARYWLVAIILLMLGAAIGVRIATELALQPLPESLRLLEQSSENTLYFDRNGIALNTTYQNRWNTTDTVALHDVPTFLQQAFLSAEDQRFYRHKGGDWLARMQALKQNILADRVVRGASTISEQVVKMLHPRPRTLWSRWCEGVAAARLEQKFGKSEIFEFYLNQVPYRAQRRGIVQAARYYFNRDLSTLNQQEMLALAVMVRAPQWLNPHGDTRRLHNAVAVLHQRMSAAGYKMSLLKPQSYAVVADQHELDASHFVRNIRQHSANERFDKGRAFTTLDAQLQAATQTLLDRRLQGLAARGVKNGAVLISDHQSAEVLAWVVGYAGQEGKSANDIDAVLARRQPGSTLKPLLYAKAMQKGWTAATMLHDTPLEESVGLGLHAYQNYSGSYYGLISLREALGNSLNIPAVKAVQFVGSAQFLDFLYAVGIQSLGGHPNVYGDGLALGNGEVSLYELVQAYSVIARMGEYKTLSMLEGESASAERYPVLSEDISSIIADILSDPVAREKEFGRDSVLNFPYQTAVKTGTSSDYRDAWALGFNDRYTVGVWMGDMSYAPMDNITGSTGPAIVLRAVFNELNRHREVKPLYLSPRLVKHAVCHDDGQAADASCLARDEWFVPGSSPATAGHAPAELRLRKPTPGLRLAMDPRIPNESEYFEFSLGVGATVNKVKWYVNQELIATTEDPVYLWQLAPGNFVAHAEVELHSGEIVFTNTAHYSVQ